MLGLVETIGDRLLSLVVPRISAAADLCSCHTSETRVFDCYCNCGAGSLGSQVKKDCTCDGCHWFCGKCYDTWTFCGC